MLETIAIYIREMWGRGTQIYDNALKQAWPNLNTSKKLSFLNAPLLRIVLHKLLKKEKKTKKNNSYIRI